MRPLAITAVLLTLPFVLLSACGSADVIQNSPTTYSVSAEWGSSYGGWDNAKLEATAKATQFCGRAGKQVALRDEQRSLDALEPQGTSSSTPRWINSFTAKSRSPLDVVRCLPRPEGSHEATRVHHASRRVRG